MPDNRLNPEILKSLMEKTGLSEKSVRNYISKIRQKNAGLTMNAAAQAFALQRGTSFARKLNSDDRSALAQYQSVGNVNVFNSSSSKVDNRAYDLTQATIQNLSIGDRSTVTQQVGVIGDELKVLLEMVEKSTKLNDQEKNDYAYDIQAIAGQLDKSKPNRSIIGAAWESVKALADVEGFAQFITRMGMLMGGFIQ